jgi:hypothetical protein
MSNKTQLQNNNAKYASLIEALRDKAVPTGGEDVTEETSAYTTKLASLETAVAALESELEGKASGGSGGGDSFMSITISTDGSYLVYYWNSESALCATNVSGTIDALCGLVFMIAAGDGIAASGEYISTTTSFIKAFRFLSNSGILTIATSGGGD